MKAIVNYVITHQGDDAVYNFNAMAHALGATSVIRAQPSTKYCFRGLSGLTKFFISVKSPHDKNLIQMISDIEAGSLGNTPFIFVAIDEDTRETANPALPKEQLFAALVTQFSADPTMSAKQVVERARARADEIFSEVQRSC